MLAAGDLLFDPATRRIYRNEVERKLSPKANAVLLALAETPRQVWSRSALLERVWPAVNVGEEVLTHAIAELRRALGDDPRTPRFLETVHKSGYRLLLAFEPLQREEPAPTPAQDGSKIGLGAYADYLTACDLYEQGGRSNMLRAVQLFSSVVRDWPSFGPAHSGLAAALADRSVFYPEKDTRKRALDHCATAHRMSGGSAEAFATEGLVYALEGDTARSVEHFGAALTRNPESARTHYMLARACMAEFDYGRAALMFERAARLQTDDYRSLVVAGKSRLVIGDEQGAKADLALALPRIDFALALRPNDSHALCNKARCLWEAGRVDETQPLLEASRKGDDPIHYNFASTLARTGQHAPALDVLEELLDLGWRSCAWLLRDRDFDDVRSNRRFNKLAAAICPV